jgi:hypothetical protein
MSRLHLVQLEFDGQAAGTGFGGLRAALPAWPVQVADPVRFNTAPDAFTGMALRADRLLASLTVPPGAPVAIQAYCTGLGMALAAAARLGQAGYDVRLLQLFNPEAVSYEHLEAAFAELADRLGVPAEESRRQVRDAVDGGSGASVTLGVMRAALLAHGAAFARTLGVPEDAAGTFSLELVNRYCAWLNFLLSSAEPVGRDEPEYPPVSLYLTRPCPALDWLRPAAKALAVTRFEADSDVLSCPDVLASAAADLGGGRA